jgi:endonuclease YncB( thermonuclease family)
MILTALLLAQLASPDLTGRASVIDGDTLEIAGQRIRLHGIDAPESAQTCTVSGKAWRCGQQAALELSNWIGAATVTCSQVATDRYKRMVARCQARGEDIGGWLVSNGWALDWPQYSRGEYKGQQEMAKAGKRGVWQGEFLEPWEYRRKR